MIDLKQKIKSNKAFIKLYRKYLQNKLSEDVINTHLPSLKASYSQRNINIKEQFYSKEFFYFDSITNEE